MTDENKDLVNKGTTDLTTKKRVSGEKPAGMDDVDMDNDIKMPRLAILQATSGMVVDDKGKLGELAHSVTKENFGTELEFIPLFMWKSRAQFEISKGLVMMSRHNDVVDFGIDQYEQYIGKSIDDVPHDLNPNVKAIDWSGKDAPSFSLIYNVLVLLTGDRIKEFPMCLSMMRTAVTTAKDFLSMVTFSGEDMFSRAYKLSTKKEDGEKGKYAVPLIDFVRRVSDDEYTIAQSAFNEFFKQKRDIEVDLEGEAPQHDQEHAQE